MSYDTQGNYYIFLEHFTDDEPTSPLMIKLNLTNFNDIIFKKMSVNSYAKEVKCVRINKEPIILKTAKNQDKYLYEKNIYMKLKDEDFLPKLKYYDDEHFILGLTDVGDTIEILKIKNKKKYNKLVKNINKQIKNITNKLFDKYGLYHNDLREKNICINKNNKVRIIDFEFTNNKLLKGEKQNFIFSKIK